MMLRRYVLFLSKWSQVFIKKQQGLHADYTLRLDDAEIRLPYEKLKELHKKIEGVLNEEKN